MFGTLGDIAVGGELTDDAIRINIGGGEELVSPAIGEGIFPFLNLPLKDFR